MLPTILPQYVGIKVWKIHSFHLCSHHAQNLDHPLLQIHYYTELSEVRKNKDLLSSRQLIVRLSCAERIKISTDPVSTCCTHFGSLWLLLTAIRIRVFVKTVPSKWTAPTAFIKIPAWLVAGKENIATLTHSRPNQTSDLHLPTVQEDLKYHLKMKALCQYNAYAKKVMHYTAFTPKTCVGWCMLRDTDGFHSTSLYYLMTSPLVFSVLRGRQIEVHRSSLVTVWSHASVGGKVRMYITNGTGKGKALHWYPSSPGVRYFSSLTAWEKAAVLIPHCLLVFLNEFLLLFLLLHPVLTWNDKVRCDPTLWAGPGEWTDLAARLHITGCSHLCNKSWHISTFKDILNTLAICAFQSIFCLKHKDNLSSMTSRTPC